MIGKASGDDELAMTKIRVGFEDKLESDCVRYTKGFLVLVVRRSSQICPIEKRQKHGRRTIWGKKVEAQFCNTLKAIRKET